MELVESRLRAILPEQAALLRNFPNPLNPETWIPFQLHDDASLAIMIYDAAGLVVRPLDQGYQPTGYYWIRGRTAHRDGRNDDGEIVSSGAYFIQMHCGDSEQLRRVILRK